MISIKITNAYVLTMDDSRSIIEKACVCVENGVISYIGNEEAVAHLEAETIIDAQGNLLMPGIINAHTHVAMNLYKGFADDLHLKEWLEEHIFPVEAQFCTYTNVKIGARLGIMEMIASGTTCFADMYYHIPAIAEVCEELHIRALLGQAIIDFKAPDFHTPQEAIAATKNLIEQYKNHALIRVIPAPHSPYTCSKELLRKSRELALEYNIPLHIHIAETSAEYATSLELHKKTPVQYLHSFDFFAGKTIAAHCVYVSEEDTAILSQASVHVVHNPQSNMKLVSGIAPVQHFIEAGVNVALGTDGAVSNNALDMFQEMKIAALLQKLNQSNATVLPAEELVYMCTRGAAKALDLDNEIGSIEVGKKADIIMININQPHLMPLYSIYSHIVYAMQGHDVDTVIIDGTIVYLHKQFTLLNPIDAMIDAQIVANSIYDWQQTRKR